MDAEVTPRLVYILNESSREIHRAFEGPGGLYTLEKCNVDQIIHGSEIAAEVLAVKGPGHVELCGHCFPGGE